MSQYQCRTYLRARKSIWTLHLLAKFIKPIQVAVLIPQSTMTLLTLNLLCSTK